MGLTNNLGKLSNMITSTGSAVGIGTSSPSQILNIYTTSKAVSDRDGINLQTSNSTAADVGLPIIWSSNGNISNYATSSIAGRRESATGTNYGGYLQFATTDSAGSLAERMRITSTGKVGIGLTNPSYQLSIANQISNGANPVSSYTATSGVNGQNFFNGYYAVNSDGSGTYPRYFDIVSVGSPDGTNGGSNIRFFTNPIATSSPAVERMRISSNGNVGIGTNSPNVPLAVVGGDSTYPTANGTIVAGSTSSIFHYYNRGTVEASGTSSALFGMTVNANPCGYLYHDGTNYNLSNYISNGAMTFSTVSTERMRITSGGYVGIGSTGAYLLDVRGNISGDWCFNLQNSNSASVVYGMLHQFNGGSAMNNASSYYYYAGDSAAQRCSIRGNGGIYNFQANDSNLSDIRTKKDIYLLESYWDKFKAIEIVKFKYKDQQHDDFNIGVIAQQVEEVAPEFVDTDYWDNPTSKDKTEMKSIFTTDLYHATIKVLQEAMAKIEILEAEIKELKNK